MALLVGLSDQQNLTERFKVIRSFLKKTCPHWRIGTSYDGWVRALQRELSRVLSVVIGKLREHMQQISAYQTIGGWNAFGVDGSDSACPRTRLNQAASSSKGQHDGMPLLSMTVMHHLRLGIPWAFRVGSSTESERSHLEQMVGELPPNSLIVADAGFPGYACCRNMLQNKQHFLLRVGGNVHLLKDLGYDWEQDRDIVYLWPNEQQDRKEPPLKLRLIVISDEAKQPIYLITSVLDPAELTQEQAREIYYGRWEVETFFRAVKQTMDLDGVQSRTPSNCYLEMTWALMSVWLLKLMTIRKLAVAGIDPLQMSVAKARDEVRSALRNDPPTRRCSLSDRLAKCHVDSYRRPNSKASRRYPRKKRHRSPSPPQINSATKTQRELAQRLTPLVIAQ